MISIGHAVVRATVWAAGIFYRIERAGSDMPEGPAIIVCNHPNMLMDPLIALHAARRRVRVLAKAPLFELPIFGRVLRAVDTLPLYRVQDDPSQLPRNKEAFQESVDELRAGGTLLTFPEGGSHGRPALAPLKTGAARIALVAEEETDWRLGLRVVPTGLTYYRKHLFRSRVVASLGEPIAVADWRSAYQANRAAAIRSLTLAIGEALARSTLNLSAEGDRELVETAELLYARAKGRAGFRQRQQLGVRLPQLQRFAAGLAWLRANDADRFARLEASLRDYRRRLQELGGGDADVPPRYEIRPALRFLGRELAILGSALPAAALGSLAWYLPSAVCGLVARLSKPGIGSVATVKLLAGVVVFPAAYLGWIALAYALGGPLAAASTAVALPPLGFAALLWHGRRKELWEDVKLFSRVVRDPGTREWFAAQRAALSQELDAFMSAWQDERAAITDARSPAP